MEVAPPATASSSCFGSILFSPLPQPCEGWWCQSTAQKQLIGRIKSYAQRVVTAQDQQLSTARMYDATIFHEALFGMVVREQWFLSA